MKIQLDWLKTFVDPELATQDLYDLLTMGGLEIEGVDSVDLGGGRHAEVAELNVTPNRGYCLSHIGVAREVAALAHKECRLPNPNAELAKAMGSTPADQKITVVNEEPLLCPRYAAIVIENVTPGPSPQWLVDRLKAMDLRPINNIVDITNFVLMEYGQPLHAFDGDLLAGSKIVIRRARRSEPFTSLDGSELKLEPDALVIADAEKPVALAGIMGGVNSQVTLATRWMVLESAFFDPVTVRKSSKKYNLRSDSSYRFERSVDIEAVITAQSRAALLIKELAGGEICAGRIDIYPTPRERAGIDLRISRTNQILGTQLSAETITGHLKALGMAVKEQKSGEAYRVTVPHFRPALTREIDLIEEVARLNGYGSVAESHPMGTLNPVRLTRRQTVIRRAKAMLSHRGISEAVNYSFIAEELAQEFLSAFAPDGSQTIPLSNPINSELGTMRTSLLPGLIQTAVRNLNKGQKSIRIFEQGNVYFREKEGITEIPSLAVLMAGTAPLRLWNETGKAYDYHDVKGALEFLLSGFKVSLQFRPSTRSFLDAEKSLEGFAEGVLVASLGQLNGRLTRRLDLHPGIHVFEMNVEVLVRLAPRSHKFSAIPKFPETYRDISILLDQSVKSETVTDLIRQTGIPLIHRVDLYDLFEGKKLEKGKKSLTFALSFQSPEKTLTDAEVNPIFDKIVQILSDQLGAQLRQ